VAAAEPGRRIIIKKKGGGHGHHGGAWKVAYADFVTAMMALFMVMWLLASTDTASRKEISQYFRTGILPDGDMAMKRAAQARPALVEETTMAPAKREALATEEAARELNSAIETMVKADPALAALAAQVSISVTEDGILIEAIDRDGQSMLFDSASSALKPGLITFLHKLAPLLAERKNRIQIMGHTDARPYVSKAGKTNWDLSYERATNARKVLETSGLARNQVVSVDAHGSSQPRNPIDPLSAENRRLAILVVNRPRPPAAEGAAAATDAAPDGSAAAPAAAEPTAVEPATPSSASATPAATTTEPAAPTAPVATPMEPGAPPIAVPTEPTAAPTAPAPAPTAPAPATTAPAAAPATGHAPAAH
jgi:chemotaxis protein MotB